MTDCCSQGPNEEIITLPDTLGLNFYLPDLDPPPVTGSSRHVKLTWQVSRYNYETTDGIRVRITASNPTQMPDKIFAYQLLPLKPGAEERVGAFDHVCSPTDLEEYPEDEPIPNDRPAWFRLNYVDVLLRSRAEVKEFIEDVIEDVQRLKSTLDIADMLLPGGETWIGTPPTVPAAPTSLQVAAGNAQAVLTWVAPTNNGGSVITDYRIQRTPAAGTPNWTTVARPVSALTTFTVTGLTNGTAYLFRVAAINVAGVGAYVTAANSVTPTA